MTLVLITLLALHESVFFAHAHSTESTFRQTVCRQCNAWCHKIEVVASGTSRIGKTGPVGPKGPPGPPGVVNLTAIEELVDKKIEKAVGFLSRKNCNNVDMETAKLRYEIGGVFDIFIPSNVGRTEVFCDVTTDGGNWIVFQRRMDGSVDFFRNWNDYVIGFGSASGELWLGLEAIHQLTKIGNHEMRIDMIEMDGTHYYAKYSSFEVGPASDFYRLRVSGYSGNATDSLASPPTDPHNDQQFTTKDADHDRHGRGGNCAVAWTGGWWYNSCGNNNLNGVYGKLNPGITWYNHAKGTPMRMRFTELKVRPKQ